MQNQAVHWYEGLFLRPQHFQAAERYWTELTQTSQQWDHPFNYGLHSIDINLGALGNHQLEVTKLQARMRDGTLVSLEQGSEPDRVDLKDAFEKESSIDVYLAVPKLKLGRINVGGGSNGDGDTRFREMRSEIQDESQGGNDQEIQFRHLNARLMLSTQDRAGFELLPIARIKRAGAGEAVPQLDESYIPPVLAISSWSDLGGKMVRAVHDVIGAKLQVLAQQVSDRAIGLGAQDPGDAARIVMLTQLNSAYSALGVMAFAQGVHPFDAYVELCRIYGQLAIFDETRRADDIPGYDHEDLHRIFKDVKERIERLINKVQAYEYEQRPFVGSGMGLKVSLEPKWFHTSWQWFIGVRKGDLGVQEVRDLLSPGQLDWKFGSSRQVEILFQHRAEGVQLVPMDRAIRALPARQDWVYYEVKRNESPAWRDVQETQTMAVRLKDSLIMNLDKLQGEKSLVVLYHGRSVPLEFALFAVPTKQ